MVGARGWGCGAGGGHRVGSGAVGVIRWGAWS